MIGNKKKLMKKIAQKLKIKVKLEDENAQLPTKAHDTDMGWDLYAIEDQTLEPDSLSLVDFGIKMELPEGFGAFIKDRSSMAEKKIHVFSGVVDNPYRGHIMAFLYNFNDEPYEIKAGDRVAQIVPISSPHIMSITEVDEVKDTKRGDRAFGSSGK